MASTVRAELSQEIDDAGVTPMFVTEKNDTLKIRKGQYSIKMSYYNRKVYFHIQSRFETLFNFEAFLWLLILKTWIKNNLNLSSQITMYFDIPSLFFLKYASVTV